MKSRRTFYRHHLVPLTSCSEANLWKQYTLAEVAHVHNLTNLVEFIVVLYVLYTNLY